MTQLSADLADRFDGFRGSDPADRSPLPLVLAVVGHRDPVAAELPRLRRALREDLEALLLQLPHTPLLMLNGLASGMDSEAAEVFLAVCGEDRARRPEGPAHALVAALPKRLESYRLDFRTEAERCRLEALLRRCTAVLDPANCSGLRGTAAAGQELPEPECYGQQGVFLVRYGFLLLAFHNGHETMAVGGTAQSVAMQRGQVHPLFLSADEVIAAREPGALIEYDTPRISRPSEGRREARTYWLESRCRAEAIGAPPYGLADLLAVPRRLETINRWLLAGAESPQGGEPPQASGIWRYANAVASRAKRRYLLALRLLIVLGVGITVLLSQRSWLLLLGLALVTLALWGFPRLQRTPKHRFIEHRCLAESLTVQELWAALAVDCDAADLFHSQIHQDLDWIRTVLRSRHLQLQCRHACQRPQAQLEEARALAWIQGQVSWFEARIDQQTRQDRCLLLGVLLLFSAALLLSALDVSALPWALLPQLAQARDLLIGGFAGLLAYRELLGHGETNARYSRSRDQFRRGLRAFAQAFHTDRSEPNRARRLRCALEAVGREKLDELNDWVADQLKRSYRPG